MPTATTPLLPLPPWHVKPFDATGNWTKEWFDYFTKLNEVVVALRLEIP